MNENEIYSNGCVIILHTRFWGATKTLSKDQLGDLPEEIITASRKLLVDSGTANGATKLEAVRGHLSEAKRFVKTNCMFFPIPHVDFINKNRIEHVDYGLRVRREQTLEALEELIDSLSRAKSAYKSKFPKLYSEANYPTADQLRENFIFKWMFRIISPPSEDSGILSPEIYKAEIVSFKKEMKDFQDSIISTVAKEFYDRIDKLREQCLGNDVSATTIKSINTVLDKFSSVYDGCINQNELRKMIEDVKSYMEGTEAIMLKQDDDFRFMVGDKMKEITGLIINSKDARLTRKIDVTKQE